MISNGQTITTGTFLRALKVLNPRLRVCSFEGSKRLAGLYLLTKQGRHEDICGVDKKIVPAYATFDDGGHIIKSGWRRVFWILVQNGYTSHQLIEKVAPGFYDGRACSSDRFVGGVAGDPIENKLLKWGTEELSIDQILELGQDVRKKDTAKQTEDREHDKWFLETWKKTGQKPKY